MKFKYYLRGAGIGVIAATVVLSAAFLFQDDISDAQIIQRALELGMVMEEEAPKTLADISAQGATKADLENGADDAEGTDAQKPQGADNQPDTDDKGSSANGKEPDDTPGVEDGNNPDNNNGKGGNQGSGSSGNTDNSGNGGAAGSDKDNPDDTTPPKNHNGGKGGGSSDKPDSGNTVTVTIVGGDVSRTVSAKVFEAGLVDSADEFNGFLGSHDYDNQLQPGTYEIEKGSSFEQIAKILTSR